MFDLHGGQYFHSQSVLMTLGLVSTIISLAPVLQYQ